MSGYAADTDPTHIWTPRSSLVTPDPGGVIVSGDPTGYLDPEYGAGSPFAISGNDLRIRCQKATSMGVVLDDQYTTNPVPYIGGFITTRHSFAYTYGVVRCRVKLPNGANVFPAFWELSSTGASPPEIDWAEWEGEDLRVHLASISAGPVFNQSILDVGDLGDGEYHDLVGVKRRDVHRFYIDGNLVATKDVSFHPEFQVPMFLVLNCAIHGTPDVDTPDSLDMLVSHVQAWPWA